MFPDILISVCTGIVNILSANRFTLNKGSLFRLVVFLFEALLISFYQKMMFQVYLKQVLIAYSG